ncbi:hypothetical protein AALP_AA2G133000 [Arabis alpina]|uniref:Uncharacterized protein n=1 Tax=Arabis alpina TaxID=50452 RepID=A0A087HH55_ARAAL|nr:hypothetical protein AALP_AA2G133000 [Arabis alpina]
MQVVSPSSSPVPNFTGKDRFAEIYGILTDDFESKLNMGFTEKEEKDKSCFDDEEEEEEEFSFAVKAENSPISAEDAFQDGQIRPVYPLFNRNYEPESKSLRSPLKKLFVETEETTTATSSEESEPMGPYCSWSGRTVEQASPETCRKSNSTGFSKLWRFRDLVLRSNSDGKDAFVFLSNGESGDKIKDRSRSRFSGLLMKRATEKGKEKTEKKMNMKTKSAHERLYMRNRAIREEGKRKSYLPYKHVGFFTNVNGLTRNVHPY